MSKLFAGIDDSKVNRTIFEETAKLLELECLTAENGVVALQKITETVENGVSPEIIVTDINMPEMDGIELIGKLKEHPKTKYIPIIVLSTESDYQIKIQSKNLGAAGWLTKPFSPEELAEVIKKFLRL